MNSQNTPVHIHLWHRDFWLMALSNLLVNMAVYMLIPVLPDWLMYQQGFTMWETGVTMGAFGVGLFLLGGFTSFLVQHYRRNHACEFTLILMACCLGVVYYADSLHTEFAEFWLLVVERLALGATFGLAQMMLCSTLIIDTSESFQRTEANHSAAWFSRFAVSLGPLTGLIVGRCLGFSSVLLVSIACAVLSALLIMFVNFPFRTPDDEIPVYSLDRFLLPQGWPLSLNLLMITTIVGLLMTLPMGEHFYAMLMAGFLLALLSERYVFRDADLKSQAVTGLVLIMAALLMLWLRSDPVVGILAPLFVGFSLGIIGARFLLFFIKLSRHCQRGTSQSTYMLSWESGIALGLFLGFAVLETGRQQVLVSCLVIAILALLFYNVFTHPWFLRHKNR